MGGMTKGMMMTYEKQRVSQTKGPTYKFNGRLLIEADDNPRNDKNKWLINQVWETEGGAWIAVLIGANDDKDADFVKAAVIEFDFDEQARIFEVMDALEWSKVARSLARKMGWSLNVEVA
jgi:hypothetical protein